LALEIEVCGRVFGCHPDDLDPKEEKQLIEMVAADIVMNEIRPRIF